MESSHVSNLSASAIRTRNLRLDTRFVILPPEIHDMTFSLKDWARRRLQESSRPIGWPAQSSAAILTLGLATAWGADAEATDIRLQIRLTEAISRPYALYYNLNGSYTAFFALGDSVPGGVTIEFHHELPWEPSQFRGFGLVGLHGPVGSQGVTLALPDDSLIAGGGTWESFITEIYGGPEFFYSQQFIADNWGENFASTIQISFPRTSRRPWAPRRQSPTSQSQPTTAGPSHPCLSRARACCSSRLAASSWHQCVGASTDATPMLLPICSIARKSDPL